MTIRRLEDIWLRAVLVSCQEVCGVKESYGNLKGIVKCCLELIIVDGSDNNQFQTVGIIQHVDMKTFFFFHGPIRSDDQPPVPHIVSIFSIQRDPMFPS